MARLQICRHTHNTNNSKRLILHSTASSQAWQLQRPIASRGHIHHNTNHWHKATIPNNHTQMVGRPTRTLLLDRLVTRLMCIRGSLLTTEGTCCLPSKSHPRNLPRYPTSKTSPSNKRLEASKLRRMLEGRNTIHISNLWRLLQRLVWLHRRMND